MMIIIENVEGKSLVLGLPESFTNLVVKRGPALASDCTGL